MLTRRLPVGPATLDAAARTFSAIAASAEPVQRPGPAPDGSPGPWLEILAIDPTAIDLSRLIGGPVLLGHDSRTRDAHIGAVAAARIEGGLLVCDCQLSPRPDVEPIVADIAAGVLNQTSIGYRVEQWRKTAPAQFRAVRWTPLEVSLLPIAADGQCRIRSFSPHPIVEDTMTDHHDTAPADQEPLPAAWTAADALALTRAAGQLGLSADIVGDLHDRGLSVDAARNELIDAAAERSDRIKIRSHRIEGGPDWSDPATIRTRMVDAVLHRMDPGLHPLPDHARDFAGCSLADLQRTFLQARGERVRGLSDGELFTRSLHSTSDFPLLLAGVVGKSLDRHLREVPNALKAFSRQQTAPDFRSQYVVRAGIASPLLPVNEAGEFKSGTFAEERESIRLTTWGRIWGVTRQALVNDDLNALATITEEAALAAAEVEAQTFTNLLVGAAGLGAVMSDGKTAFHADHGNIGTGGVISETTLSEARQLLRAQKATGGQFLAGAEPRALVVPPALETLAGKTVAVVTPADTASVNVFSGLAVAVEPRLSSAARWYVFSAGAFFAHAYLGGITGPEVTSREGFTVDGLEIRVRYDFAAAVRDHRFAVTNAGG